MARTSIGTPILVLLLLAMMIFPLPPFLLDMLFTFNISLSLLVLLACIYTQRPLNFSIFPTILLLTTLLRLALNIASTRVVLLNGHHGTYAAGHVIHSFGSVVIGSNYAVGLIVFCILVIINFVVVTKGATRISEVNARFTLDALPGKQSAVDAELNAGLISQQIAKERRDEIAQEADFYGSMDGASKFVRGDAIAAILILMINIVGGIIIGILQHSMSIQDAIHNYTLLTIGDGLAAQVPSLLLSTATALIVTRATKPQNMNTQVLTQLFDNPKSLGITALVIAIMGLIPGMPHLVFLSLAAIITSAMIYFKNQQSEVQTSSSSTMISTENGFVERHKNTEQADLDWNDVTQLELIRLEIGTRLIKLIHDEPGNLLQCITSMRKKVSQEMGFLIPPVHVCDNLNLRPNTYRVILMGVSYGDSQIPAESFSPYNSSGIIASHLGQVLQQNAAELLGHEEAEQLLSRLEASAPSLAEALVPNAISLSTFVAVLRQLLAEYIPIIDIRNIATSLVHAANKSQEPNDLTAAVRVSLRRLILQRIVGHTEAINVITFAPELESIIKQCIQSSPSSKLNIDASLSDNIIQTLKAFYDKNSAAGQPTILLCSAAIRARLSTFIRSIIPMPQIHTLSYAEIPDDRHINVIGTLLAM